jgi:hypothetical protein
MKCLLPKRQECTSISSVSPYIANPKSSLSFGQLRTSEKNTKFSTKKENEDKGTAWLASVRGMNDLLPQEKRKFDFVTQKSQFISGLYGFEPVMILFYELNFKDQHPAFGKSRTIQ